MSRSSDQMVRLLALVPYLRQRLGVAIDEVASHFGITVRQVRRDLEVLQWCGLPQLSYGDYIEIDFAAIDGSGMIHLTNADYFARPLRFTPDEAVALLLALSGLREVADPEQQQVIDTASAKLSAVAGEAALGSTRTEVRVSGGADDVRSAVHQAMREDRQLQITYDSAARGETRERTVDPMRATLREGFAYLDAWCHEAGGLRSFRLDRVQAAQVLATSTEPHPGVELPDPGQRWFAGLDDLELVTLRLAPNAHWVAQYYPAERVTGPDAQQVLEVEFVVSDPAWLQTLLLRLGDDVIAVEPSDAVEPARQAAQAALQLYATHASASAGP